MIRRLSLTLLVAVLSLVGTYPPAVATAAQPRASVAIASNSVKLSDLFSGLEVGQDCDIGPAPAPGKRILIGQAQLTAIAEQFGVEWQPGVKAAEVMLERMAKSIRREDLLPPLRAALVSAGAPESADITMNNFAMFLIPTEIASQPEVESIAYDHNTGRYSAELVFESPGHDISQMRITGVAQEMIDAATLIRTMNAGSILESGDIQVARLRKSLVGERALSTTEEAIGLALRHRMMAGSPISSDQLSRPLMITRGMPVLLRLENTGLVLTAKGEAIDGGTLGERVHILNTGSRAILVALVTGPGQVKVDLASAPVLLSSEQSGLPPASALATTTQSSDQ